jgi:hypothetical protein
MTCRATERHLATRSLARSTFAARACCSRRPTSLLHLRLLPGRRLGSIAWSPRAPRIAALLSMSAACVPGRKKTTTTLLCTSSAAASCVGVQGRSGSVPDAWRRRRGPAIRTTVHGFLTQLGARRSGLVLRLDQLLRCSPRTFRAGVASGAADRGSFLHRVLKTGLIAYSSSS